MTIAEGSSFPLAVSCPKEGCDGRIMVVVTVNHLQEMADTEEQGGKGYSIAKHTIYDGSCDSIGCVQRCRVLFAPVVSVWPRPG